MLLASSVCALASVFQPRERARRVAGETGGRGYSDVFPAAALENPMEIIILE